MLIYQLITKQKTYTHKIHFQLPYGIKGTNKLWRIGSYIYIYMTNVNKYWPMLVKVQKKPKKNVKKKSKNTSSSIYKAEKIK